MAYTANIVTVAEMKFYAGAGIDNAGDVEANHTILQNHAEGYLSNLLKFNLTTGFSGLTAGIKNIISEWAARFSAIALIQYNMLGQGGTGFTRIEAEDRINVHAWRMNEIIKTLQADGVQGFLGVNT